MWEHCLKASNRTPSPVAECDWVAKYRLIEAVRPATTCALAPQVAMTDLTYHDVDRAVPLLQVAAARADGAHLHDATSPWQ